MTTKKKPVFLYYFDDLEDPRIDRKKLYPLVEILFIVLCGSACGAESWRDYVLFGKEKLSFLKEYFPFEKGVPSKNTFYRVFAALEPDSFKSNFMDWVKSFQKQVVLQWCPYSHIDPAFITVNERPNNNAMYLF